MIALFLYSDGLVSPNLLAANQAFFTSDSEFFRRLQEVVSTVAGGVFSTPPSAPFLKNYLKSIR
ncbi:hypothetical protein H6F73_00905 [Microcoleus sp. FACHB-68]|nr:hypothetical protein [Microcoleus sp. FACHB-68]